MRLASVVLAVTISCAFAGPKVAILDTRRALISTVDGTAAEAELHRKFDPEQAKLKERQAEIDRLRSEGKPVETLANGQRRANEDARLRFDAEQKRVYKELSDKLMVVVKKYARQKHFEVVLDGGGPNSSVVWRNDKNDITEKIIQLYDRETKKR